MASSITPKGHPVSQKGQPVRKGYKSSPNRSLSSPKPSAGRTRASEVAEPRDLSLSQSSPAQSSLAPPSAARSGLPSATRSRASEVAEPRDLSLSQSSPAQSSLAPPSAARSGLPSATRSRASEVAEPRDLSLSQSSPAQSSLAPPSSLAAQSSLAPPSAARSGLPSATRSRASEVAEPRDLSLSQSSPAQSSLAPPSSLAAQSSLAPPSAARSGLPSATRSRASEVAEPRDLSLSQSSPAQSSLAPPSSLAAQSSLAPPSSLAQSSLAPPSVARSGLPSVARSRLKSIPRAEVSLAEKPEPSRLPAKSFLSRSLGGHLLAIESLAPPVIEALLDLSQQWADTLSSQINSSQTKKVKILEGKTVINFFFEPSTRTRTSFEVAAKHLGANVVDFDPKFTSVRKGESLLDTASVLNAYSPAILVMRHASSGAAKLLSDKVSCPTINAGDGCHEHPTQALLDALTIRQARGTLQGLRVAICGDVRHSRVARSNYHLLTALGSEVRFVGPATLLPCQQAFPRASLHTSLEDGLEDADIVMMLRVQTERMEGNLFPSVREYYHFWGLTPERLGRAKAGALVLHPGPMNRGVEIASEVADDIDRSAILRQLENGVAVRCACLEVLSQ